MAFGKPIEDELNSNVELEAIQDVLRAFQDGSTTVVNKITAQISAAQKNLDASAERSKTALYKKIADLYAQGIIKTNEQAAALAKAEMQEQQADKLRSEIKILQTISKENEAERKKQEQMLELEREILIQRAKGNEDEARQKEKELAKQKKKEKREERDRQVAEETAGYEFGDLFAEKLDPFFDALADENHAKKVGEENLLNAMKGVANAVKDGLNAINDAISEYAKYQGSINARLQGVSSYSDSVKTLSSVAFSPLLRAEDLYANLADLVGQGIVTNVEQRAMFATMKDNIAGTFDVTSDSLKRLIRVQQNDSTAARLGMEAYLTEFLNVYVQNTEYLQSTFDTVSSSLLEASATMMLQNRSKAASNSAELEFVVQKWLGTLSGVGLSDTAASSIAEAIGQLGSGNINALSSNDMQNLIVMAANKAGLNYGEMLNDGLDASDANELIKGMVVYLQEIAATGTNVVKSQLADVFGVTISDLAAVMNLSEDALNTVHADLLTYNNMYGELTNQFKQLPSRLGIANILENLFANLTYQTGMSIASNPVTYALWKITDMIQSVTGGINIPYISVMGSGFDLNATVEGLMQLGIVGISTLGNIGKIASGLASIGDGSVLLKKLKVAEGNATVKTFGGSTLSGGKRQSGSTTSETTYVGNNDGDTYADSATNAANDDAQKDLNKKQEEAEEPITAYFDKDLKIADRLDKFQEQFDAMIAAIAQLGATSSSASSAANASANAANALLQDLVQSGATAGSTVNVNVNNSASTSTGDTPADNSVAADDAANSIANTIINSNTSMQANASDVSMAGLATITEMIISQMIASHTSNLETFAPVATAMAHVDASSLAILSELMALSGNVVSNAQEIEANLVAAVQRQAATAESIYSAYSDNLNQELENNYQNITGNVTNQFETTTQQLNSQILGQNGSFVVEDINTTVNTEVNPNIDVAVDNKVTVPDVNIENNIPEQIPPTLNIENVIPEQQTPDVNIQNNIPKQDMPEVNIENIIPEQSSPNLTVENTIPEQQVPDVDVKVTPEILVQPPAITFSPVVNVESPNITLTPTINVESPVVNLAQDINVMSPDVAVNPTVNVAAPNVVFDPTIDVQPQVNLTPQFDIASPVVNFNPEITATVPNVTVEVAVTNPAPMIAVDPEITNDVVIPAINIYPQINNEVQAPPVNVKADVTAVIPELLVEPQIINNIQVPDILVEVPHVVNNIEVLPPAVYLSPEIINTIPNITLNPQITTPKPEINVVSDVTVEAPNVEVNPQVDVLNTVPNINVEPNVVADVRVPDIEFNPEINYSVPNVVVDPEIIANVSAPIVNVTPEITTTVPEITLDPITVAPEPIDSTKSKDTSEYDKYIAEQGIINNNIASNINQSSDVSDYLIQIDFASGFKNLVESVYRIKTLLEDNDNSDTVVEEEITGFSQFTFNT